MDPTKVYEKTLQKQANRIASLTLDLDLAHSQIDILNEQLAAMQEKNNDKEEKDSE